MNNSSDEVALKRKPTNRLKKVAFTEAQEEDSILEQLSNSNLPSNNLDNNEN